MLDIVDLSCVRGDRTLFRSLSFSVRNGQLLHLQGANGSGKTSLLRTLCGVSTPAAGEIRWQGTAIRELGDSYGEVFCYVGHGNGIHGDLTAVENLHFSACLAGSAVARTELLDTLRRLGLGQAVHLPAKFLSQGQKRRLALARLFIQRRPLWILDEPFTALDVRTTAQLAQHLADHVAAGGMVVLTSHQEVPVATSDRLTVNLDT